MAPTMKTQVVSISKMQTSKVMALMYLVISIPFALLTMLSMRMTSQPYSFGMMIMMPVLYTIFGFIFTFVGAWIYNGIAAKVGGIEFRTSTVEAE
jgi:hypothetical protein